MKYLYVNNIYFLNENLLILLNKGSFGFDCRTHLLLLLPQSISVPTPHFPIKVSLSSCHLLSTLLYLQLLLLLLLLLLLPLFFSSFSFFFTHLPYEE